jgi:2-hydroxychromene-2-carboxylate isomerase
MTTTVGFWFDFASTYSYPAAMRIESVAQKYGTTIEWNAFLLGPVFKAQGWNDSPFNIYPAKGKYMWRDMERICESLSIPFRRPTVFPRNGIFAARIGVRFKDAPWIGKFVKAMFTANFAQDMDIGDHTVVAQCVRDSGMDPDEVIREATSAESKPLLRLQNETAAGLNLFGAPSFVVNGELFWGNDRMEQAFEWPARKSVGEAGTTRRV